MKGVTVFHCIVFLVLLSRVSTQEDLSSVFNFFPSGLFASFYDNLDKVVGSVHTVKYTLFGPEKVCYPNIGCFTSNPSNGKLPYGPVYLNVTFIVFTARIIQTPYYLVYDSDDAAITGSLLDPKKVTNFVAHGYDSQFEETGWMGSLKNNLLQSNGETNDVVIVNWPKGSTPSNLSPQGSYDQAAANTRSVGAILAYFIRRLGKVLSIKPQMVHLIGHSLGAHLCGFAGSNFSSPHLSRITALDPAAPGFDTDNPSDRIDPTDADLVDAIHTDGLVAGLVRQVAHVDMYPNGGANQPGCDTLVKIATTIMDDCSHDRAYDLYLTEYQVYGSCEPIAYTCQDYDTFERGECADCGLEGSQNQCIPMGLLPKYWNSEERIADSNVSASKFFLKTSASVPFCLFHYQLVAHVSNGSSDGDGCFKIKLVGDKNETVVNLLAEEDFLSEPLRGGYTCTKLLTLEHSLGHITGATVDFTPSPSLTGLLGDETTATPIKLDEIKVNYMSSLDHSLRETLSAILVPVPGNSTQFYPKTA